MRCSGSRPQKTPVSVKIRTYDARRVTRVAMENVHICMAKSNNSRGTLSAHSAVILTVSDIVFLLCLVPYDMTNKSLTKVFLRYSLASSVVAHPLHLCYCVFFLPTHIRHSSRPRLSRIFSCDLAKGKHRFLSHTHLKTSIFTISGVSHFAKCRLEYFLAKNKADLV